MTRIVVAFWRPSSKPAQRGVGARGIGATPESGWGEAKNCPATARGDDDDLGWIAERLAMGTPGYVVDTRRKDNEFSKYANLRD